MLLPPRPLVLEAITCLLQDAYKSEDLVPLHGAIALFTASYGLVPPKIQLVNMRDLGNGVWGRCHTDKRLIQLVKPGTWKKHGTGGWRRWAKTALHECYHFCCLNHTEEHANLAEAWLKERA